MCIPDSDDAAPVGIAGPGKTQAFADIIPIYLPGSRVCDLSSCGLFFAT
jgi:hypothetical protein